jgi:flagellar FliL protein
MARKKKGADGEGGEGKKKKGNLLPAIVIAVGLIVGGKMMGGGKAAPAASASATSTTSTTVLGPVIKLDPITLNMADGHFLRVGLGFQMTAEVAAPAKPDTTDASGEYAKALDIAIKDLGGRSYGELVTPTGRDAAKEALLADLKKAYPKEIEDVYFTEFVLQ